MLDFAAPSPAVGEDLECSANRWDIATGAGIVRLNRLNRFTRVDVNAPELRTCTNRRRRMLLRQSSPLQPDPFGVHLSIVYRCWMQPFRRVPRGRIVPRIATEIAIEARATAAAALILT